MSDYKITTPMIDVLISDEYLAYEGIVRPWKAMVVADRPSEKITVNSDENLDEDRAVLLGRYFQDIQGLISKKLYDFSAQTDFSDSDGLRLVALTQELVKVKKILTTLY